MACHAYFHFQLCGNVGLGKMAWPGDCAASTFPGIGARVSTTFELQLPFPICPEVCRYFWLSGSSCGMEEFRRTANRLVDYVRCSSHSWLGCPGRLGSALAERRDNLLLFRIAVGCFPYSVWSHRLVGVLACAKLQVNESLQAAGRRGQQRPRTCNL